MPKGTIIKTPTLSTEPAKYEIVESIKMNEMEERISSMMANGWKPCGGLAVRYSNTGSMSRIQDYSPIYTQAMTKGV